MKKKMHWTQTEEGKKKIRAINKKRWQKSKAERAIEKKLGGPKVLDKTRESIYSRAAAMAVETNEVPKLMNFVAHQLLMKALRGEK